MMGRLFLFIVFSLLSSLSLFSQNRNMRDPKAYIEYVDEKGVVDYYTDGGISKRDFNRATKIVCDVDPLNKVYTYRPRSVRIESFTSAGLSVMNMNVQGGEITDKIKKKILNSQDTVYISVTCTRPDACSRILPPIRVYFTPSTNSYRKEIQNVNKD